VADYAALIRLTGCGNMEGILAKHYKEFVAFTLKHGNFFVAISSAAIALMSLWLTIDAGLTDREYKELSIRPAVEHKINLSSFSWQIENAGLGPARIKRIITETSLGCFDTSKHTSQEWIEAVSKKYKEMLANLRFALGGQLAGFDKALFFDFESIVPGTTLRVGDRLTIIQLVNVQEVLEKLKTPELLLRAENAFSDFVETVNYDVEYCSLTGRFCSFSISVPKGMQPRHCRPDS